MFAARMKGVWSDKSTRMAQFVSLATMNRNIARVKTYSWIRRFLIHGILRVWSFYDLPFSDWPDHIPFYSSNEHARPKQRLLFMTANLPICPKNRNALYTSLAMLSFSTLPQTFTWLHNYSTFGKLNFELHWFTHQKIENLSYVHMVWKHVRPHMI